MMGLDQADSMKHAGIKPVMLKPWAAAYAWAHPDWIHTHIAQALLPEANAASGAKQPIAELWYGTHPQGPNQVPCDGDAAQATQDLWAHLQAAPKAWFGAEASAGSRLSFLAKILAAGRSLSIQVHPSASQAEKGFAGEEEACVPLGARHRRFKDPYPKPELLVAWTPFEALVGFRAAAVIERLLRIWLQHAHKMGVLLEQSAEKTAPELLLGAYYGLSEAENSAVWMDVLNTTAAETSEWLEALALAKRLHAEHPSPKGLFDRGLIFAFLLQPLTLKPGEAVFLAAGIPHAYLHGVGVEVMAPSDNVLRAGLTGKFMDPTAVLQMIDWQAKPVDVQRPKPCQAKGLDCGDRYLYQGADAFFKVQRFALGFSQSACIDALPKAQMVMACGPDALTLDAFCQNPAQLHHADTAGQADFKIEMQPGAVCLLPAYFRAFIRRGCAGASADKVQMFVIQSGS